MFAFSISADAEETLPTYDSSKESEAASYVKQKIMSHETGFGFVYTMDEKEFDIDKLSYDAIVDAENEKADANSKGDDTRYWDAQKKESTIIENAVGDGLPEKDMGWTILSEATKHTGKGDEGDYLLNSVCGSYGFKASPSYSICYDSKADRYYISVDKISFVYNLSYYTTAAQEEAFKKEAVYVMASLGLSKMSDYDKVCAIYSYIAENVTYDTAHVGDDSYKLKQSAYAALINKTAVCQGYASLFYYLANASGVDCRIVKGEAQNNKGVWEHHAWNLVKVGDKYYYVDVTWDSGREPYDYFLKGSTSNEFNDHKLSGLDIVEEENAFTDPAKLYSVSEKSYYDYVTQRTELTSANTTVTVKNGIFKDGRIFADFTVVLNGKELIKGIDYKVGSGVFYSDQGICVISITGIGLYQSTIGNIKFDMVDMSENSDENNDSQSGSYGGDVSDANSGSEDKTEKSTVNISSEEEDDVNAGYIVYASASVEIKKGDNLTIGDYKYKVTKAGKSNELQISGGGKKLGSIVVPDKVIIDDVTYNVTAIGKNAFKNGKKLSKVTIGKNVKSIGSKAFYGCKKLKNITVRSSKIKSVGSKAFKSTYYKAKVKVPAKKVSKYKKLFIKKGLSKKSKITK
jgi:sorbitol-specific phosphotransferase system component IIA